ncbi:unnamed protein product [Protopolystoma xenopodis]|uniref:Uncharacterized protein n=1 Tax=Protopolystoma xenopodis TaxID=117903 RepID=A0A3S5AHD5_9PLAT|nr:unnamed protein product [Protopolystoma xenopodis]
MKLSNENKKPLSRQIKSRTVTDDSLLISNCSQTNSSRNLQTLAESTQFLGHHDTEEAVEEVEGEDVSNSVSDSKTVDGLFDLGRSGVVPFRRLRSRR